VLGSLSRKLLLVKETICTTEIIVFPNHILQTILAVTSILYAYAVKAEGSILNAMNAANLPVMAGTVTVVSVDMTMSSLLLINSSLKASSKNR
jgi:hypothetical protein